MTANRSRQMRFRDFFKIRSSSWFASLLTRAYDALRRPQIRHRPTNTSARARSDQVRPRHSSSMVIVLLLALVCQSHQLLFLIRLLAHQPVLLFILGTVNLERAELRHGHQGSDRDNLQSILYEPPDEAIDPNPQRHERVVSKRQTLDGKPVQIALGPEAIAANNNIIIISHIQEKESPQCKLSTKTHESSGHHITSQGRWR
mmetsp:Transcript_53297/g.141200  ORF Transcript_53297/g.141200 Transcript_53297/m.141200 type:complete len:202 (+) Transcript_53297:198-803(+)